MYKRFIIMALLLILVLSVFASDMLIKTLPNGMQVIIKKNTTNQSVGMICVVKTGSMHEDRLMGSGISHHIEHVVSGGSTTLHSEEYYGDKDKEMGAVTNAFTTFDKTAYHTLVNKEYYPEALQLLAEHIQHCAFDSVEVAREQQVIAKEIVMGATPPYSQMYWKYRSILYNGTNVSSNPTGYAEQLLRLKRSDLVEYYNKRYAPNNMIFILDGDVDVELAMKQVEAAFAGFQRRAVQPVYLPGPTITVGSMLHKEEFDIKLPMVYIDQIIPASGLKDYFSLLATADILINKQYSPIQKKLYEELQLVNYIYASVEIDHSSNTLELNIGFEAKETSRLQEITDILYRELSKYRKGYFKQEQLDSLIHLYQAEHLLKTQNLEDEFTEICDTMIEYGIPDIYSYMIESLQRVRPADLTEMVNKYLTPADKFTFYAIPQGQMTQLANPADQKVIVSELKKITVDSNITLIYKQNTQSPIVRGTIMIPTGTDYETDIDAGSIQFMADMLLKGSRQYPLEKLTNWMESKSASIYAAANRDNLEFFFSCLASDLPEMQRILIDAFSRPAFSGQEISLLKEERYASAQRSLSSPEDTHSDYRSKMIYTTKREQLSTLERNDIIQKITRQDLTATYQKYFKAPQATISIVGDQTESQAKDFARSIYRVLNHSAINATATPMTISVKNQTYISEYPFEQVNIDINLKGPNCLDPDYPAMKVIETVLSGSNGRIFQATRGTNNLSYFAYASYTASRDYGFLRVTSQTSADKTEMLKQVLLQELNRIMNEPVPSEEISRAIEAQNIQMHNLITDEYIGMISVSNEQTGLGFDYQYKEIDKLRKVTAADVQRVAQKYLKDRDIIISIPSKDVNRMVDEDNSPQD